MIGGDCFFKNCVSKMWFYISNANTADSFYYNNVSVPTSLKSGHYNTFKC